MVYSARMIDEEPRILAETEAFLVAYKPRGMHSAPLAEGEEGTLLAWCAERCPAVLGVRGRKEVERGLLHRLDRDTAGLVLLAKTRSAYDAVLASQEAGEFLKEYGAVCRGPIPAAVAAKPVPFVVESAFRAFGPGRRAVRAVDLSAGKPSKADARELALDRGSPYSTEVMALAEAEGGRVRAEVRLRRGFRHQVRCHLAWIGLPIIGDALYGDGGDEPLALSATALAFPDPESGRPLRYAWTAS